MALAVRREAAVLGGVPAIPALMALIALLLMAALLLDRPLQSTQVPAAPELRLQVGAGGGYLLDGHPVSAERLATALRVARDRTPDLRLRIAAADDGDYHAFVGALAVAEHVGVRNIGSEMH